MIAPELVPLLEALSPHASLPARLDALEALAKLHFEIPRIKLDPAPSQIARLRALIAALREQPRYRDLLAATIKSTLRDTTAVALFSEAGIPNDRGLASETIDRVARRVLPRPPDDANLERFVLRVFRTPRHCAWIEDAPLELLAELGELLGDVWGPLREAMSDAIALLATRISALGLSVDLRERSDSMHVRDSPFFRIPHVPLEEIPMVILECRTQLGRIHERLETTGVSVDVVYCTDTIRRMLLRVERMLPFVTGGVTPAAVRTLLAALTAGRIGDESLRQLGRQNLALLAKKVIERVGHTGEHYMTTTRREYWAMAAASCGGGAVIGGAIVAKYWAKGFHLPPFIEGVAVSGVYVAAFLVMQFLGLVLATKQPSMTAAALAATIKDAGGGAHKLDELVNLIARIARTQFVAAVGNVIGLVPMVVVLDLLCIATTGGHFFDEHHAREMYDSVDPRHAITYVYGALTGILLWISSLGAGWLENWVTYRRLPEAIRYRRLPRIADGVSHHAAGIGGNTTLGTSFGMMPPLSTFFGVPLDSRHFTISTGCVVFAVCTLGIGSLSIWSVLGIAVVGILNFGVSFTLALGVAFRARDVKSREQVGLAMSVLRSFARRPLRFFYPPLERLRSEPAVRESTPSL